MTVPVPATVDGISPWVFATYMDARALNTIEDLTAGRLDAWTGRHQFVALPMDPEWGKGGRLRMFHREQNAPSHRAVWRSNTYRSYESMLSQYNAVIADNYVPLARGWISPPIVVRLTPAENAMYSVDNKTPWKVLERAGRVSRKLGFRI